MVTTAIIAILAAIAYPSFMESIRKSRRSDAIAALTRVQQAQERHRANFGSYASTFDATAAAETTTTLKLPATSQDGHYTLALSGATGQAYTATATASSSSPQIADLHCRELRIVLQGSTGVDGVVVQGSKDSGGTLTTGPNNACWIK